MLQPDKRGVQLDVAPATQLGQKKTPEHQAINVGTWIYRKSSVYPFTIRFIPGFTPEEGRRMDWLKRRVYYTNNKKEFNRSEKIFE